VGSSSCSMMFNGTCYGTWSYSLLFVQW
jgi:hypothetical protein